MNKQEFKGLMMLVKGLNLIGESIEILEEKYKKEFLEVFKEYKEKLYEVYKNSIKDTNIIQ